ncbi:MAG: cell wall hydrolase, partial [Nitrospirae bacterium]|nr:cell wall hydrolase [Nitrospirota bacterium]
GLYYYGARYYNPQLGRFISPDSIVPNPGNPQDLNRYIYAGNNPLLYIDPTGHNFFKKLFGFVEMVVGAVLTGVGHGGPLSYIGAAIMTHGADNIGANVDVSIQVEAYSWGGSGSAGGPINISTGGGYSPYSSNQASISDGTIPTEYKLYAEAYTSDASTLTAKDEITELTRLIYAEASGEYKIPNAMEGVAWVVRNRVMSQGWPDTYYGVIHQRIQFSSVPPNCGDRCNLWNKAGNPQAFSGKSLSAYYMALTVSAEVYNGTTADPTGGALFYHSGARESLPAKSAAFFGTLTPSIPKPLGPFYFYK